MKVRVRSFLFLTVSVLFYLILLFVPVIGWIALFLLLRGRKSKTVSYAVCQDCGWRWKI